MNTVNDVMATELALLGVDVDKLSTLARAAVPVLAQCLDALLPPLADDAEALRVIAAGLRSYARVADEYAAAVDAARSSDT